ncbi:MAG: hypothetical protein IIT78_01095 [Mycoplasmataceae bacterium]|nr:hypothetical protein [Mycoplasmataceae bacterium]
MLKINIIKLNILDNIIGTLVKLSCAVITIINLGGWDFCVAGITIFILDIFNTIND